MYLENFTALLSASDEGWLARIQGHFFEQQRGLGFYPLRFAITRIEGGQAQLETTAVRYETGEPYSECFRNIEILRPRSLPRRAGPFTVVQVIPTGIGCDIGGFAGDACPATNLLAAAADCVVTHPNAVNASELNEMSGNVCYVEGKLLDDFLLGHIVLEPTCGNRVGTLVDASADEYSEVVVHTLNAATASAGLDCDTWIRARGEIGASVSWSPAGCAIGVVDRPDVIIEAVRHLVEAGCNAVGALSIIHGVTQQAFVEHQMEGKPNPSGGVEAIITHLISKIFRVPSAHAPLPYYNAHKRDCPVDPRSSAEFISTPHYFSVLKGLSRAPRPVPIETDSPLSPTCIGVSDVAAVVLPASALGGIPALAAQLNCIPIIAVGENRTILSVHRKAINLDNVIEANSYAEAAGIILALRHGISLRSLRRPFEPALEIRPPLEFEKDLRRSAEPVREPMKRAWGTVRCF
jgi:hypothetical protein